MTSLQMNYQPAALDAPITTVWDLAQFNVSINGGIVTGGCMVFCAYASKGDVGIKPPLDSHNYNFNAAQVAAFQRAANLQPGQIASFAYAFAQSIQDTVITPAVLNDDGTVATAAVMGSFFQSATPV